jgi:hypothetical protein
MEHEMKYQSFRSLKDALVGSEPADGHHSEPSSEHNEGLLRNADPAVEERIYRVRDAQAVEGGTKERRDRPGRLGTAGEGGLAFGNGDGKLKPGPAWLEGMRNRTPVQHNPSGKNDQHDVNRPKPVTY